MLSTLSNVKVLIHYLSKDQDNTQVEHRAEVSPHFEPNFKYKLNSYTDKNG